MIDAEVLLQEDGRRVGQRRLDVSRFDDLHLDAAEVVERDATEWRVHRKAGLRVQIERVLVEGDESIEIVGCSGDVMNRRDKCRELTLRGTTRAKTDRSILELS